METSTILKQKANEIVETLGKLYPEVKASEVEVREYKTEVFVRLPNQIFNGSFRFSLPDTFTITLNDGEYWTDYSAKTCFGAFTKWINAEIEFHQKEIEKLVQLNTNLLGLGEKK